MLKANVLVDGQPTLLIALDPRNRQLLPQDRPIIVRGAQLGMPYTNVILVAGPSHGHVAAQFTRKLGKPVGGYTLPVGDDDGDGGLLRMSATIGQPPVKCMVLGLSAANLVDLDAGTVFHVVGAELGLIGMRVCLLGLDVDGPRYDQGLLDAALRRARATLNTGMVGWKA